MGSKWGKSTVETNKCSSCLLGKLERSPKTSTIIKRINEGSLKKNVLRSGQIVFSDQFESRVTGRVYTYKGKSLRSRQYKCGTIFFYCETGFISIYNQTSFTSE